MIWQKLWICVLWENSELQQATPSEEYQEKNSQK